MANPQKEDGYTAIANEILEQLTRAGLNGTELAIVLFIIRKTYGYRKKQDAISISQFVDNLLISKQMLCKSLNNLQVVNIITLVKKGSSKGNANIWALNKNWETWKVVNKYRLVNQKSKGSKLKLTNVVNNSLHTKERKKITKESISYAKEKLTTKMSINSKNQQWQDIAADVVSKLADGDKKRSSIFKCFKDDLRSAQIAFEDCKELGKTNALYFLKVYNELRK